MATPRWQPVDVRKIPKELDAPVVLRFTEKDWLAAIKGATEVKTLARAQGGLVGIPNPDGPVDVYPVCPDAGPDTICIVKMQRTPTGVMYVCQCKPRRGTGSGPGGGTIRPPARECRMEITLRPFRWRCVSEGCDDCRLELARITILGRTAYMLRCRCAR